MDFPEWFRQNGYHLFADHTAVRSDPYAIAKTIWDAAIESTEIPEFAPATETEVLDAGSLSDMSEV